MIMPRNHRTLPHVPHVPSDCRTCPVRARTLCRAIAADDLGVLERFKTMDRVVPAGTCLYQPGDAANEVLNLLDGWVMVWRLLRNGRRQIIRFALPGDVLAYRHDPTAPLAEGASCLTDVAVCVFPRRPLPALLAARPEMLARLAELQAAMLDDAERALTNVGARTAHARLAFLLVELALRARRAFPATPPDAVRLPLTQEHLGDALGYSAVHISKLMHRLRMQRLVRVGSGWLDVVGVGGLAALADVDGMADITGVADGEAVAVSDDAAWPTGAAPAGTPALQVLRPRFGFATGEGRRGFDTAGAGRFRGRFKAGS
jgi:CRP-like cAMP-binding protein